MKQPFRLFAEESGAPPREIATLSARLSRANRLALKLIPPKAQRGGTHYFITRDSSGASDRLTPSPTLRAPSMDEGPKRGKKPPVLATASILSILRSPRAARLAEAFGHEED